MPTFPASTSASLQSRLARLGDDQRAAATAPPGPVLCVAPAGSGKTTTLIARIAWLIAGGVDPGTVAAITFNKRAAEELSARLATALEPIGLAAGAVRVRTFHALGREILRDAGVAVEPLVDRDAVLREIRPGADAAERRRLDTAISRLKLDLRVTAEEVAADPVAGPVARSFVAYERAVAATGGLDFDDLVIGAIRALDADALLLRRWRGRCAHLLVDEVQDVDRSQLRLALLLAAPANQIFLVGDDDQSIYGWRLADVRRVLGLAAELPGLRRFDLEVNHRCPPVVVERAVRLIEGNRERFAKRIRPGPANTGRLILAPSGDDAIERAEAVLAAWPDDDSTRAILARTNRELVPAALAAAHRNVPFRAPALPMLVESADVDRLLDLAEREDPGLPLLLRIARARGRHVAVPAAVSAAVPAAVSADPESDGAFTADEVAGAMVAWAPRFADLATFRSAISDVRAALARLRSDDAPLSLATAHSTKGLEFDHVAVIDMDAARFPSARTLADSDEPERALEEERRLAYVAWTRARRSLALVYDPAAPSTFLLEAFEPEELGVPAG